MSEPVEQKAETMILAETFEVTHSETIGKLVLALAKAQLNFKPVLKQNENEAFRRGNRVSKYADLATYIDATQEALAKEELVVIQWPDVAPEAKSMSLVSILAHSSGEWMRGKLTLPATGRDGFTPQTCGSSITYARRYSYAAITGCASEDDDGNAASQVGSASDSQAVGAAKTSELKAKVKKGVSVPENGAKPALFFIWYDESQTAEVTGDRELMKAHWLALKPFWRGDLNAVVMKAQELEDMKYYFEQKGVLFKPLEANK